MLPTMTLFVGLTHVKGYIEDLRDLGTDGYTEASGLQQQRVGNISMRDIDPLWLSSAPYSEKISKYCITGYHATCLMYRWRRRRL